MTEQNSPRQPPESRDDSGLGELFAERKATARGGAGRWARLAAAVAAACVLAYLVWQWAGGTSGVQRKSPEVTAIIPLPPPPPPPPQPEPPPEPEPPPPEPRMAEPQPTPEPTPADEPEPADEAPAPSDSAADPMQMDAEAQAGGDAFSIGAGSGRGLAGSGGGGRIGNATYGQYLGYALQKRLREDADVGYLGYQIDIDIWVDREGRITRTAIVRSSGDPDTDRKVQAALDGAVLDQSPTSTTTMPAKVRLVSRRPS